MVILPDALRLAPDFKYGEAGFYANNDGVIYRVTDPDTARPPLHPGDCIDLARTSLSSRLKVLGGMGGAQFLRQGETFELYVFPRQACAGGSRISSTPTAVNAKPVRTPAQQMVMIALQQLLGCAFIAIGLALVWQRPSRMTWGFFLYSIWFNPGQDFISYAYLQQVPSLLVVQEVLQEISSALGIIGLVQFALRFPNNITDSRWTKFERYLPLLSFVLVCVHLLALGASFGLRVEQIARISYLLDAAIACSIFWIFFTRRKSQTPQDWQRTRWVLGLGGPGLLTFLVADAIEATTLFGYDFEAPDLVLAALYVMSAALSIAVWHAVRRHRVIDVRFALSRGATLLMTWITLGVLLVAAGLQIEDQLKELLTEFGFVDENALRAKFSIRALAFTVPIICFQLAFEVVHEKLNHACDLVFFRHLHTAEKEMLDLGSRLRTLDTPAAVERSLTVDVARILELAWAQLFWKQQDGSYARASARGAAPADLQGIDGGQPLVRRLRRARSAVRLGAVHGGGSDLSATAAAAVPVFIRDDLIAVALYSAHAKGDDLKDDELTWLSALAVAAGDAYARIEADTLRSEVQHLKKQLSLQTAYAGRRF